MFAHYFLRNEEVNKSPSHWTAAAQADVTSTWTACGLFRAAPWLLNFRPSTFSFSSPVYKVPGSIFKIDERQNGGDVEEQQQQQSGVSVIGWSIYDFDTTAAAHRVNFSLPPSPPHPLDTSVLINSLETKLCL